MSLVLVLPPLGTSHAQAADRDDPEETRTGKGIKLRKFETVNQSEEYEKRAEEKRMESISLLKDLLKRGVSDDEKAEMMLRLADLYFQQGRYLYLNEMEYYDTQYEACFNAEDCNPDLIQPNNSGSQDWQEKSIKLYQGILKNYPRYPRADQATFFLGSALKDLGREKSAADAFKQLVKLYPQSDFVPEAYVLIGDYYFEIEANAFPALKAFQKATQFPDNSKYSYALYKLGWCYYNVGEYEKGIESMKKVVDISHQQESKTSLQLRDEALKDLVRFFADADEMDGAISYFTQLGRSDLIRTTLHRLAALFYEQGKFSRAVEMYRRLILDDATSEDNPEFQGEIISAYKKLGQREKVLEEIERLRTDYGANSAWAKANASDPTAVTAAQERIEKDLRTIAVEYHDTGRKYEKARRSDASTLYELARAAYASYLDLFPTNDHSYDVRYAYGELLYQLKDFEGAFTQYMAVVDIDPNGKHSKFCAESAIFAAEEQIKLEGGAAASGRVTAKASDTSQAIELTAWEQRFVDACNKYATLYPTDKRVKDVIYKSAYLLYNKYRFDEAAEQFRAVIAMDPRSREAELGANLILDALNVRKNWEALRTTSKAFHDQDGLGSKAFKTDTYKIYENASFKLIEVGLEKSGDKEKAADGFVAFYEEFPESPIAAQALNNASAYYAETKRVVDSVKVRHILVDDERFAGKTKYYYDQVGFLGYDYELIADLGKASDYYERLWGLYGEEKEKPENKDKLEEMAARAGDAIYSAAVFRKALGEWERAIENYRAFVAAFPDDDRVPETLIRIGTIYEENARWQDALDAFQAFYRKAPKKASVEHVYFTRLHAGQAQEQLGDIKKRDALYKETVALYKRENAGDLAAKGPHTEFVAEMMYQLAQPMLDRYGEMQIRSLGSSAKKKAEDKHLESELNKKSEALRDVETLFTEVVDLRAGEWGLASLVALGKAYENMAATLRNGDTPFYLTEEQSKLYKLSIEDVAYVQDEKAVNVYKAALDKAFELTLYNDNTAYAIRQLGVLRPEDYPGLSETLREPRWTADKEGRTFDFETSL